MFSRAAIGAESRSFLFTPVQFSDVVVWWQANI